MATEVTLTDGEFAAIQTMNISLNNAKSRYKEMIEQAEVWNNSIAEYQGKIDSFVNEIAARQDIDATALQLQLDPDGAQKLVETGV